MLWQIYVYPRPGQPDLEARRIASEIEQLGIAPVQAQSARGYLIEAALARGDVERIGRQLLADPVIESFSINGENPAGRAHTAIIANVLPKPGVMDPVAQSVQQAIGQLGLNVDLVRTFRTYWIAGIDGQRDRQRIAQRVLANDAIEQIVWGPLRLERLEHGSAYRFELIRVPIRTMTDSELERTSRQGQLSLSIAEMRTIQRQFRQLGRDPTDAELETLAQTWSEHCSHKTLRGQIEYEERDSSGRVARREQFQNLLRDTIFRATQEIRRRWGPQRDWCVSVFEDNAGVVRFDDAFNVCFKVETHNHPSAIEPYGGANTGVGGVIRDPMGTGLGAKPIANTDVFCFAPPDYPSIAPLQNGGRGEAVPALSKGGLGGGLPPGVLHPKKVMKGVVAGVRDYGNRMGIPTVNGAIYFDERYLGNPLVFCGNVGLLPRDRSRKEPRVGDLIIAIGGRTGRDGIHGATFSSVELTHESEGLSGGAVQIGNAITEKMMLDVILAARDRGLYHAITDCGAGGFSSAVGEMAEKIGAEVWLDRVPLKYAGLSYTEIWISEAQERMVLAVPESNWPELSQLCSSEGVEATIIGRFEPTGRLVLKYHDQVVGDLEMQFLHEGRPPVVRKAIYKIRDSSVYNTIYGNHVAEISDQSVVGGRQLAVGNEATRGDSESSAQSQEPSTIQYPVRSTQYSVLSTQYPPTEPAAGAKGSTPSNPQSVPPSYSALSTDHSLLTGSAEPPYNEALRRILSCWNVCSKEWVIRQYDHEVQGGSVVKPLVGVNHDGPSDAAVIRPVLSSYRGLAIACGMNPRYGDLDPYWMAASAIDEAVRNCVAVGADPERIAILDNFCWGNTDRPEELGSLVRAALACRDVAIAYGTPFISGKDSLNNEFRLNAEHGAPNAEGEEVRIVIPPTLLISALGQIDDVRQCVTMDLKEPGNLIYLVGQTKDELGGSHYNLVTGTAGCRVPTVDARLGRVIFQRLHKAIKRGLIRSCHDLSEGGLAVALAEMAIAGGVGARIDLHAEGHLNRTYQHPAGPNEIVAEQVRMLFSESNSRFLVEVPHAKQVEFIDVMEQPLGGVDSEIVVPFEFLGNVANDSVLEITDGSLRECLVNDNVIVQEPVATLKESWQRPLRW